MTSHLFSYSCMLYPSNIYILMHKSYSFFAGKGEEGKRKHPMIKGFSRQPKTPLNIMAWSYFIYYGKSWNGKKIHLQTWFFLPFDVENVVPFGYLSAMVISLLWQKIRNKNCQREFLHYIKWQTLIIFLISTFAIIEEMSLLLLHHSKIELCSIYEFSWARKKA